MLTDDIPRLFIFLPALADPSAAGTQPFRFHQFALLILLYMLLHHPLPQLNDNLTGLIIFLDKRP